MKMHFETADTDAQASELFYRAVNAIDVGTVEVLEIYANQKNWGHICHEGRHYWVWTGPVICGFELAERTVRKHKPKP
jgi:hypothetical protein